MCRDRNRARLKAHIVANTVDTFYDTKRSQCFPYSLIILFVPNSSTIPSNLLQKLVKTPSVQDYDSILNDILNASRHVVEFKESNKAYTFIQNGNDRG